MVAGNGGDGGAAWNSISTPVKVFIAIGKIVSPQQSLPLLRANKCSTPHGSH
jgi:hypothetical protein